LIKTGGENVASREVEEVVYGHTGVAEAAVFGIAHPYWIEAVTAVVVPRDGEALDPGELPKNPSGKILKRELRVAYGHLASEAGEARTRS
jgi:fatty-acyl-CoA synthase